MAGPRFSAENSIAAGLTPEEIDAKEWKYTGYRGFSSFLASDDDVCIIRKFGSLNVRVILALQDEIVTLEQELAALDNECSQKTRPDCHNGSFKDDLGYPRSELLRNKIYGKLKDYSMLILNNSSPIIDLSHTRRRICSTTRPTKSRTSGSTKKH
jgi:hypothetical protein